MDLPLHFTDKAKRDLELVNACKMGKQWAFTQLLGLYRESVYFMMLKLSQNETDAEDLMMEAFSRAFKNIDLYKPEFAFSTWLFKIASNNALDFLRKKKLRQSISLDAEQFEHINPGDAGTPEHFLLQRERKTELNAVIQQLKPHYQKIIELYYFEDLSQDEISKTLNISISAVKVQLYRARNLLIEIINKNPNGPRTGI